MNEYKELVKTVLKEGQFKENRTGVDTISKFGESYTIDLREGFPLLTRKKMDGFRWKSLIYEIIWYISGEEHIRNLREHTGIWDEWSNEEGHLDTAYGRFWRRYPIPSDEDRLDGESWPDESNQHVTDEGNRKVFDQIGYIQDQLENNPKTRRMVLNAWHPANAAVSTLPPCHYSAVFNVQEYDGVEHLNCHLSQRSADIALGVPFNIAAYSIITKLLAQRAGMKAGKFHHTLVDAHVYCGQTERSSYYRDGLDRFQAEVNKRLGAAYSGLADKIENEANEDPDSLDHVPGLLRQISRERKEKPTLEITDKPLDELEFDDFTLKDYESHDGIYFGVAE